MRKPFVRVTLALLACVCSLLQMCALQQLPCAMAQTDSHEGVECARRCQLDFFPSAVLVNASTGREDFTAQGACVYGCTCTHPESCEGFCKEGTGQTRFLSSGLFVDFGRDLNTQEFYVGCMLGCRDHGYCTSGDVLLTQAECKTDYCVDESKHTKDCKKGCSCSDDGYGDCLSCCDTRISDSSFFSEDSTAHRACTLGCLVTGETPERSGEEQAEPSRLYVRDTRVVAFQEDSAADFLVYNGTVQPEFRALADRREARRQVTTIDPRTSTYVRPEESSITLSLSCDSAAPALYNNTLYSLKVTAGVDEAGTESLATIVPSLALTGVLKANRTSLLRLDFDCVSYGTTPFTVSLSLTPSLPATHPRKANYTTEVVIFLEKTCFAPCNVSSALCGGGMGPSQTGACDTDDICQCPTGFESDQDCRFGIYTDKEVYCPHEQVTLSWEWLKFGASPSDLLYVLHGKPELQGQLRTHNEFLREVKTSTHVYMQAYVDGDRTPNRELKDSRVNEGSFVFELSSHFIGNFSAGYLRDDSLDSLQAMAHFEVLNATDPVCLNLPESKALKNFADPCSGHGLLTGNVCSCFDGFFGLRCERGCAFVDFGGNANVTGGFGGTIAVDSFTNQQNCRWHLIPQAAGETASFFSNHLYGVKLTVRAASLESGDRLKLVTYNYSALVDEDIVEEIFLSEVGGTVSLASVSEGGPDVAFLVFTSNDLNPSWEQTGFGRFEVDWVGSGCPPGSYITSKNNVTCRMCPPGTFTTDTDATECKLCPVDTFQPHANSTGCLSALSECPESFMFVGEPGQSTCVFCKDFDFPAAFCDESPNLSDVQVASVVAAGSICFLIGVTFCVAIWVHRRTRVMMAGTLSFMYLTVLGVAITLGAVMVIIIPQTDFLCNARIWLFNIGLQLVFAPLFAKTYRLHKIFNNPHLRARKMGNKTLLKIVGLNILGEVVILTVGVFVSPYYVESTLNTCNADNRAVLLIAEGFYKGTILVYGAVMAYNVRNIPSVYNESTHISIAIANICAATSAYFALTSINDHRQANVRFLSTMIGVYVLASTMVILFTPKLLAVQREKRKASSQFDSNFLDTGGLAVQPRIQDTPMARSQQAREFAQALIGDKGQPVSAEELQERIRKEIEEYEKKFKQRLALQRAMVNIEDKLCLMQHEFEFMCKSSDEENRPRANTVQTNFFTADSRKEWAKHRASILFRNSANNANGDKPEIALDDVEIKLEATAEK